jgi:hypothetical protein
MRSNFDILDYLTRCSMVAFNTSILHHWKNHGFRFILVLPREKYGVLIPLINDRADLKKGYTIEIGELSLIQMAEDYFFTKEKDAAIATSNRRIALR